MFLIKEIYSYSVGVLRFHCLSVHLKPKPQVSFGYITNEV